MLLLKRKINKSLSLSLFLYWHSFSLVVRKLAIVFINSLTSLLFTNHSNDIHLPFFSSLFILISHASIAQRMSIDLLYLTEEPAILSDQWKEITRHSATESRRHQQNHHSTGRKHSDNGEDRRPGRSQGENGDDDKVRDHRVEWTVRIESLLFRKSKSTATQKKKKTVNKLKDDPPPVSKLFQKSKTPKTPSPIPISIQPLSEDRPGNTTHSISSEWPSTTISVPIESRKGTRTGPSMAKVQLDRKQTPKKPAGKSRLVLQNVKKMIEDQSAHDLSSQHDRQKESAQLWKCLFPSTLPIEQSLLFFDLGINHHELYTPDVASERRWACWSSQRMLNIQPTSNWKLQE